MDGIITTRRGTGRAQGLSAACLAAGLLGAFGAVAAPPSVSTFAMRPRIELAALSPDGKRLAIAQTQDDRAFIVVVGLAGGGRTVVLAEPEDMLVSWCRWATNERIVCGFSGTESVARTHFVYGLTRMIAVNADGTGTKILVQNSMAATGQFQDRVIAWRTGIPNTVLIAADKGIDSHDSTSNADVIGSNGTFAQPAVWELDVINDRVRIRQRPKPPIRDWLADSKGAVRIGYGLQGDTQTVFARPNGSDEWRVLSKFRAFSSDPSVVPVAISDTDPDKAYAIAPHEGYDAVWLVDLKDEQPPALVHAEPGVDMQGPVFGSDDRLVGFYFEREGPEIYYVDQHARAVTAGVSKAMKGQYVEIAGNADDGSTYLLSVGNDVNPTTYAVFERASGTVSMVGEPYPGLDRSGLRAAQPIHYPARDGTSIPGYLTLPADGARSAPLVVLPHGGPISRDALGYDFLRQFLVSRGYAVLQMNFRGSGGLGSAWQYAAHQDWGGLTYDDVIDGVRWAVKEGYADPKRMCIVGWSFGGYVALLGAQRNADLFRCSVSIAGVSDLGMLVDSSTHFIGASVAEAQIGTDDEKLDRNSPRLHAAEFGAPVLLLHGDRDPVVQVRQSEAMAAALERAGKPVRYVPLPGAGHSIRREASRAVLLTEIETFLARNLAAASPGN
ncbi:MAG: alpha/beta fold hydrolase [Steroidobacteraceae bacterium]